MVALYGYDIDAIELDMSAAFSKTITDADITLFAGISGDTNPVHLDEDFASGTLFNGRIAHGMLTASLISTVIGTKLPGPGCIYLSQSLRFLAPVRIGDTATAEVRVVQIQPERRRLTLACLCRVGSRKVVEGDALILIPERRPAV
ncbi:MaoC family dehydratase [Marinivivus vitaminiproducens]|uniref:MaoC family dehydratase n=1 Tax=Marinivivus vitaminiproducens TaxID=3035935 RepID=UPI0027A31417|nr:MaoC family dehydratase [Geminicoccaceae bacterium SCSIO 64248]